MLLKKIKFWRKKAGQKAFTLEIIILLKKIRVIQPKMEVLK